MLLFWRSKLTSDFACLLCYKCNTADFHKARMGSFSSCSIFSELSTFRISLVFHKATLLIWSTIPTRSWWNTQFIWSRASSHRKLEEIFWWLIYIFVHTEMRFYQGSWNFSINIFQVNQECSKSVQWAEKWHCIFIFD